MRINKVFIAVLLLSSSLLCSSCIGSFKLWNGLKEWNQGIGNKFVNELVYIALNIVPVYGVAYFADAIVLNTIEFWTGSSPMASNEVKDVKGEHGNYLVASNEDGYTITSKDNNQSLDLVYNEENNTWNAVTETENYELVRINEDGTATVNMQNDTSMTITLDSEGISSLRDAYMGLSFACR